MSSQASVKTTYVLLLRRHLSRKRVENHRGSVLNVEIEHIRHRTRDLIERAHSDAAKAPIVFDEANDGALVNQRVVHEILLCERGDYEKRNTRAIPSARLHAAESIGTEAARTFACESIRNTR